MLRKYIFSILFIVLSFHSYSVCDDFYLVEPEIDLKDIHSLLFANEPVENRAILFNRLEDILVEALLNKRLLIEGGVSESKLQKISESAREVSTFMIIESSPYFREAVSNFLKNYLKTPTDLEVIGEQYNKDEGFRSRFLNTVFSDYLEIVIIEGQKLHIESLGGYEYASYEVTSELDRLNSGINNYELEVINSLNKSGTEKFMNFLDNYFRGVFDKRESGEVLGTIGKMYLNEAITNQEKAFTEKKPKEVLNEKIEKAVNAVSNESKSSSPYKFAAKIFVASNLISYYLMGAMNDFQTPYITGSLSTSMSMLTSMVLTTMKLRYEKDFDLVFKKSYESLFYKAFYNQDNMNELSFIELVELKKEAKNILNKQPRKLKKLSEKIDSFITKKNSALLN